MSILSRLFNILKASLNEPWHEQDEFDKYDQRWTGPDMDDRSKSTKDNRDPELAGYYANLEVPYGSDLETVRKAWRHLVRKYHPDLHSADPEKRRIANELTQGLNHAYKELKIRLENNHSKTEGG